MQEIQQQNTNNKSKVIILALLGFILIVSLLHGMSHIVISQELDDDQQYTPLVGWGVSYFACDESVYYGPKIRRAYDGFKVGSEIDLYEHKDSPQVYPILPPTILGLLTHITGSVPNTFILGDFVFPAIIFLLLYLIILELFGNRNERKFSTHLYAMLSSIIVITLSAALRPFYYFNGELIKPFLIDWQEQGLIFSRLNNPQFTGIIFFLAIYFLWKTLKEEKIKWGILAGLCFGALFYTYMYFWTFFATGCGLFFIGSCIFKKKNMAIAIGTCFFLGLILSIYYWIEFSKLQSLPQINEIMLRSGKIQSGFRFETFYFFIWSLPFLLFHRKNKTWLFVGAFLISGLICINQQIITGFSVQYDHYDWYVIFPFLTLANLILIYDLFNRWKSSQKLQPPQWLLPVFFSIIAICGILYGMKTQYRFKKNARAYSLPKSLLQTYDWLNKNAEHNSVVMSNDLEIAALLPTYTHCYNYFPNGIRTFASDKEIYDRFFFTAKYFGWDEQTVSQIPHTDILESTSRKTSEKINHKKLFPSGLLGLYLFHFKYLTMHGNYEMQRNVELDIKTDYSQFSLKENTNTYRLNYIIVNKLYLLSGHASQIPTEQVAEFGDYIILQVK